MAITKAAPTGADSHEPLGHEPEPGKPGQKNTAEKPEKPERSEKSGEPEKPGKPEEQAADGGVNRSRRSS